MQKDEVDHFFRPGHHKSAYLELTAFDCDQVHPKFVNGTIVFGCLGKRRRFVDPIAILGEWVPPDPDRGQSQWY